MNNPTLSPPTYYAHVFRSSAVLPEIDIRIDSTTPVDVKINAENHGGKYYGNVELHDEVQIAQLGGLGHHTEANPRYSHNLTPITEACRIYPEVNRLVSMMDKRGIKLRLISETLEATGDPEKILKTLQEYSLVIHGGIENKS